jgi:dynein light chain roadblock-type
MYICTHTYTLSLAGSPQLGAYALCRSTLDNSLTVQYAALVSRLTGKARGAVRKLNSKEPEDDLRLIRIRSAKHEIVIAPDFDKAHDYQLVVVQDPSTT